ncbi:RF-1 domain-containing protein [Cokeromyces recurvatus]|uniref:RF-1 domain-containing protein n=1 Tax=Cokeromyces recurvatus TaxID=90255 RepID=UPI00221FA5EA|nr:RF-1 domain-containing protein [Cokeromyces recurvatus]KAI7900647.1 RF-1 domain-containing protein [Cokeromyces recurvatus]
MSILTKLNLRFLTIPSSSSFLRALSTSNALNSERKKIILKDEDLIETFVKGSGPGGQCINKRSTCVDLRHIPTGIRVQCQQSRSLADNRGIARKLLREKLDELINGLLSKNAQKATKIAKQKARRARRAKAKYSKKEDNDTNIESTTDE